MNQDDSHFHTQDGFEQVKTFPSEQVSPADRIITETLPANPYEMHLLLHALKIGAIDFNKFMKEATVWAHKILNDKQNYPN